MRGSTRGWSGAGALPISRVVVKHLASKLLAGGITAGIVLIWWPRHYPADGLEWLVLRGIVGTLGFELLFLAYVPLEDRLARALTRRARLDRAAARLGAVPARARSGGMLALSAMAIAVPAVMLGGAAGPAPHARPAPPRERVIRQVVVRRRVIHDEVVVPAAATAAPVPAAPVTPARTAPEERTAPDRGARSRRAGRSGPGGDATPAREQARRRESRPLAVGAPGRDGGAAPAPAAEPSAGTTPAPAPSPAAPSVGPAAPAATPPAVTTSAAPASPQG